MRKRYENLYYFCPIGLFSVRMEWKGQQSLDIIKTVIFILNIKYKEPISETKKL